MKYRNLEEVNPMLAFGPDEEEQFGQPGPRRGFADGLPPGLDYQALLDAMAASALGRIAGGMATPLAICSLNPWTAISVGT